MIMRIARLIATGAGLALMMAAVFLVGSRGALADGPPGAAPVTMTFEQPEAKGEGNGLSLSVRLVSGDGEPITRQPVEFFVTTDLFDARPVELRRAVTNADGVATITYTPTWDGDHRITAQFAGNESFRPSEATSVLNVSGVPYGYVPSAEPLSPLRQWAPTGVIAVVLSVWLALAVVLGRVCWGVWRIGQRGEAAATPSPDATPKGLPGATVGR